MCTNNNSTMKNIIFFLVIVLCCYGCDKDNPDINGEVVNLITNDDPIIFKKSVILFDDNSYLIKTPLDTFLLGYPFLWSGYGDMKTKAINDGAINDILVVSDYMKRPRDSVYTLAYYLETGRCHLFDKKINACIKTIQVETYYEGESWLLTGRRRFYVKNKLFLETVDLISK
jgi:hypothetical protein